MQRWEVAWADTSLYMYSWPSCIIACASAPAVVLYLTLHTLFRLSCIVVLCQQCLPS